MISSNQPKKGLSDFVELARADHVVSFEVKL
jgi:hypothetical protein